MSAAGLRTLVREWGQVDAQLSALKAQMKVLKRGQDERTQAISDILRANGQNGVDTDSYSLDIRHRVTKRVTLKSIRAALEHYFAGQEDKTIVEELTGVIKEMRIVSEKDVIVALPPAGERDQTAN